MTPKRTAPDSADSTSLPSRWPLLAALRRQAARKPLAVVCGAASATALAAWAAVIWTPSASEPVESGHVPTHVLVPAPAAKSDPTTPAQSAGDHAPTAAGPTAQAADGAAALETALGSSEVSARIGALRDARDQRHVAVLPRLLALDPARDPDVAPTLIEVVAELADRADPQLAAASASRLGDWLKSDLEREEADARANVSLLVEALARLLEPGVGGEGAGPREASGALITALDSERLPVHVASLAVQGLSRSDDTRARDAIQRFRDRLANAPAGDDAFARELEAEAEQIAERALAQLTH